MIIDFSKVDKDNIDAVKSVNGRLHSGHIDYLFTKRNSPSEIRNQLKKLCLSTPSTEELRTYFTSVIDPLIRKYKLYPVYRNFLKGLLDKEKNKQFAYHKLDFELEFKDKPDLQKRFMQFVVELGIADKWYSEFYAFYGSIEEFPRDNKGNPISKGFHTKYGSSTKVLTCERRYLVDRMLLRKVPYTKISESIRKEHKIVLSPESIQAYSKTFFNIETNKIEEQIELLLFEKNQLEEQRRIALKRFNIHGNAYEDVEAMDYKNLADNTERRIFEISETIGWLNAQYSDMANTINLSKTLDMKEMFGQIAITAFQKAMTASSSSDMDSIRKMDLLVKMMATAHSEMREANESAGESFEKEALASLISTRTEDVEKEIEMASNKYLEEQGIEGVDEIIDLDEVGGIEAMMTSYTGDKESGEETEGETEEI